MVTWQRRSSLRNSRVMGITALGRSSLFSPFPFTGPPAVLARSLALFWAVWSGAMPNFALTEFSEVQARCTKFATRSQRQNNTLIVHVGDASSTWRLLFSGTRHGGPARRLR